MRAGAESTLDQAAYSILGPKGIADADAEDDPEVNRNLCGGSRSPYDCVPRTRRAWLSVRWF
jgi:hypothetical protein